MADKRNSGKKAKEEQRKLRKRQREALGMSDGTDANFDQSVIFFEEVKHVKEATIEQRGVIKNQLNALDKGSPVRKEYENFLVENQSFIDTVEDRYKND